MFENSHIMCHVGICYLNFHNSSPQLEHSFQEDKHILRSYISLLRPCTMPSTLQMLDTCVQM